MDDPRPPSRAEPPVVVILGGGYSGAATAYHLTERLLPDQARIVVVEPRAELGRGLAYSTPDPDHRLNVPDHKMTLRTDDPLHYHNWLASTAAPLLPAGTATLRGDLFTPRWVFGQYVAAQLAPLQAAGRVQHVQDAADRITAGPQGTVVHLAGGGQIKADLLVLAMSHPAPKLPRELAALTDSPALVADASRPGALDAVAPQDRILLVGSGLTSADIVATLMRRGHQGAVHVLSRHGWRSQPHGPVQRETRADFASDPARTALGLLRRVRAAVAAEAAEGITWHAVFDRLRAQGGPIWAALPEPERRKLLRHLRALWDIHRFRIAPQTHDIVEQGVRARRVWFHAARIADLAQGPGGISVTIRRRHSGEPGRLAVDRVILATGPAHGSVIAGSPLLSSLADLGLITSDPLGLGLHTAPDGRALAADGTAGAIFVAGPLARGTVGELMGVPEVTSWSEKLATTVSLHVLARQGAGVGPV